MRVFPRLLAALSVLFASTLGAQATIYHYMLETDPYVLPARGGWAAGTLSGSFYFDTETLTYSHARFTVTGTGADSGANRSFAGTYFGAPTDYTSGRTLTVSRPFTNSTYFVKDAVYVRTVEAMGSAATLDIEVLALGWCQSASCSGFSYSTYQTVNAGPNRLIGTVVPSLPGVPVPASLPLLGAAVAGLAGLRRRVRRG